MSDDERKEWLRMKDILGKHLVEIDNYLLLRSIPGNDEETFLVEKPVESPADRTERYFQQVKQARSETERQHIALTYRAYYAQLTGDDKDEADRIRRVHFDALKQALDDFEPTFQRVNELLRKSIDKGK